MKLCALFFFAAFALASPGVVDQKIIDLVNSGDHGWTAGPNSKFDGWSITDAKRLLGASTAGVKNMAKHPSFTEVEMAVPLPKAFDWRNASTCVGPILDQGACGSCWAVSAVETLQDRFCLQSNGTRRTPLSAQNLVSCDQNDGGCEGGDLSSAWNYLTTNGVVTAACTPYAFPQCNPTPCLPPFKPTPPCNRVCKDGSDYEKDKHFARNSYSVGGWINRVEDIQREIMTRGPVQAAFTVYQDFITYKSGVYSHVSGQLLGGHAIKIIGWGVENGLPYWLVSNSWNVHWGMNGFFYIKRGTDECGIEDDVVAGMVKL